MWWGFYQIYQGTYRHHNLFNAQITLGLFSDQLIRIVPDNASLLLLQCTAGTLGGFTTTILTNPLDVCRARLQV